MIIALLNLNTAKVEGSRLSPKESGPNVHRSRRPRCLINLVGLSTTMPAKYARKNRAFHFSPLDVFHIARICRGSQGVLILASPRWTIGSWTALLSDFRDSSGTQ